MPTLINAPPVIPWPKIDIYSVIPALPLEQSPVTVSYALTNNLTRRIKGRVLVHNAAPGDVRIVDLNPGESQRIDSQGPAPSSGKSVMLQVEYWDNEDLLFLGDLRRPNSVAMYPLDVSAMYQLIIGPVNISTPRSSAPWDRDTLLVSAVARYGPPLPPPDIQLGQPIPDGLPDPLHQFDANPGTQIQQVGKVEKGIDLKVGPIVAVGSGLGRHDLIFGPFLSVPGENKVLRLGYLLANSSYGNEGTALTKEMVSTLFDAAAAFLSSYYRGAGLVRTTLSHVMKRVDDVLHCSCDALMGGGSGLMTSIDLLTATSSAGQYRDLDLNQKMYPAGWYFDNVNQFFGEPSFPCNRGEYRARWVIQRTSFKPLM